jgi:large subunit ribosomal protein L6
MSRIGKKPIPVPSDVKVAIDGAKITVEGKLGKLERQVRPEISLTMDDDSKSLVVGRADDSRSSRAYHGLTRSLVANMVEGVRQGFEKKLEVVGVGYVAAVQNGELQLRVGYANEIKKKIPAELDVSCPDTTHIVVKGCDKQLVGQFAAEVRASRKPEPYKGKGIRYQGEYVKIKPGKTAQ